MGAVRSNFPKKSLGRYLLDVSPDLHHHQLYVFQVNYTYITFEKHLQYFFFSYRISFFSFSLAFSYSALVPYIACSLIRSFSLTHSFDSYGLAQHTHRFVCIYYAIVSYIDIHIFASLIGSTKVPSDHKIEHVGRSWLFAQCDTILHHNTGFLHNIRLFDAFLAQSLPLDDIAADESISAIGYSRV
jgi:hypothetical protein